MGIVGGLVGGTVETVGAAWSDGQQNGFASGVGTYFDGMARINPIPGVASTYTAIHGFSTGDYWEAAEGLASMGDDAMVVGSIIAGGNAGTKPKTKGNPNAPRPVIETRLPDRVTKALPQGEMRTPKEVKRARNFYERNIRAARDWYERRTGDPWGRNLDGGPQWSEHPRALKDGGDPLYIEPGVGQSWTRHAANGDCSRFGKLAAGIPKKKRKP